MGFSPVIHNLSRPMKKPPSNSSPTVQSTVPFWARWNWKNVCNPSAVTTGSCKASRISLQASWDFQLNPPAIVHWGTLGYPGYPTICWKTPDFTCRTSVEHQRDQENVVFHRQKYMDLRQQKQGFINSNVEIWLIHYRFLLRGASGELSLAGICSSCCCFSKLWLKTINWWKYRRSNRKRKGFTNKIWEFHGNVFTNLTGWWFRLLVQVVPPSWMGCCGSHDHLDDHHKYQT